MLKKTLATLLLACLAPVLAAQAPQPGVTRYRVVTDWVKPEKVSVWLALQRNEVMPALKKAGVASRKVYREVVGDNFEFVSYLPFPDYGEMDGPDALERALGRREAGILRQRLGDCLLATRSHLENSRDELYFDPGDAPVLFTARYRASPDRSADYLAFLRESMKPPIGKAVDSGFIAGFQVMVTDQGGETGLYVLNMFYPDFDTLDQGPPAAKMMSEEELDAFFAAGTGLVSPLDQYVLEYQPDISF